MPSCDLIGFLKKNSSRGVAIILFYLVAVFLVYMSIMGVETVTGKVGEKDVFDEINVFFKMGVFACLILAMVVFCYESCISNNMQEMVLFLIMSSAFTFNIIESRIFCLSQPSDTNKADEPDVCQLSQLLSDFYAMSFVVGQILFYFLSFFIYKNFTYENQKIFLSQSPKQVRVYNYYCLFVSGAKGHGFVSILLTFGVLLFMIAGSNQSFLSWGSLVLYILIFIGTSGAFYKGIKGLKEGNRTPFVSAFSSIMSIYLVQVVYICCLTTLFKEKTEETSKSFFVPIDSYSTEICWLLLGLNFLIICITFIAGRVCLKDYQDLNSILNEISEVRRLNGRNTGEFLIGESQFGPPPPISDRSSFYSNSGSIYTND